MATVALAAAASSAAGATQASIMFATTLGSFIDSMLVMPALFPGEPVDVGRIGDLKLMGVQEGAPANFIVGRRARVAGQLIWQNDFIDVASSLGGKGQTVTNYAYYSSCQIEITRNQINAVKRAWADGKLVYDAENTSRSASDTKIWMDNYVGGNTRAYLRYKNSTEFDDWYDGVGASITLSGFTGAHTANNGTFEVIGKGLYNASAGSYLLLERSSGNFSVDANFGEGDTISASQPTAGWANDIQRTGGSTPTIHLGGPLQNPNAHMESIEGVGDVPGFRGIAHMVMNQCTLRYYANRIPSWEFLVEMDTAVALAEAFEQIMLAGGLKASQFDVSALSGSVEGYSMPGIQTLGRVLVPLMLYHKVFVQEKGGKLYFFHNDTIEEIAVTDEDIIDQDVDVERVDNVDRPGEVVVQHIDADNDYKQSVQTAHYAENIGENKHEFSLPFAAPKDDVRAFAKEFLWRMRSDIIRLRFRLGPKFMRVRESDRLSITWNGHAWAAIVLQVTHGYDFSVEVDAIVDTISGLSFPLEA